MLLNPSVNPVPQSAYVGRLAPSPTGFLHLGHARTFLIARRRADADGGRLLLRNDDLDSSRVRPEFVDAMTEDLRWLGIGWDGPMVSQSERLPLYRDALARLHAAGLVYPCRRTRRELAEASALSAPHEHDGHDEPLYPAAWRPPAGDAAPALDFACNWRLRVPDGETVGFVDGALGPQHAVAGADFGDFLVWRKDGAPSYQLACAVDDDALGVTEVVRGEDLVKSTFRQLLLFRALGRAAPAFFHCSLMRDEHGERLAKRHDALALRALRAAGADPAGLVASLGV